MEKRVCIGKIVAAHGIRGEVKVQSYTKSPLNVAAYGVVENKDASRTFQLKVLGMISSNVRVKIQGVDDRNTAESLIGTEFYVKRSVLPQLEEEEYYQTDIIGLDVCLHSADNKIGVVAGFCNYGAGEIIEIKLDGRKETELLPFNRQYVPQIDIEHGYIIVSAAEMIFAQDEE